MKALTTTVLAALVATACATHPAERDAERLALYRAHAGEPVDSIRYLGRLDGWTPLGDRALVLWTRPSEAWLVDLRGTCTDLPYAMAISVTRQGGRVYSRFDQIRPLGSAVTSPIPCWIQEIRPVDVKAVKAAESERRRAESAERAQDAGGT